MYSANTVINKFNRTLKSSLQRYTSIAYKYNGGRNSKGGITAYHRGGGSKTRYNLLASLESYLFEIPGVVVGFSTESNRNSLIALVSYANGVIAWIIAVKGLYLGSKVLSSDFYNVRIGSITQVGNFPIGTYICGGEFFPGQGIQLARAAGAGFQILRRFGKFVQVKLPSGELRLLHSTCYGILGVISNEEIKLRKMYKAGQNRWIGKRPHVRGVAKNPIDHPHGGGQGKTKGGRPSVSPWGKLTKGHVTRSSKKVNKFILRNRNYV